MAQPSTRRIPKPTPRASPSKTSRADHPRPAMPATLSRLAPYQQALRDRGVWRRALRLGLVVGLIQVSLNQGDHWLRHEVDAAVVAKTILTPLLSFSIAFASA